MKYVALLMAVLVQTTGCLGLFGNDDEVVTESTSISENIGNATREKLVERAAGLFKNFTIAGQEELEGVVMWINGTVGSGEAVGGIEDRNDRSGNNYGNVVRVEDLSNIIPAGQPAEIRAKLFYFATAGNAADIDIYVNVPGHESDWAGDDCDEFSWKVCVQEAIVNTVGVAGQPIEVGVQIADGRVLQGMDYFFRIEVNYAKDVITPYVPYAFTVPEGAHGIVISSVKAGGDEHVRGELLVVSPADELVEYVTYDDIAIPTESKLIPVPGAGEYVIYVLKIEGGFLGVSADVPVPKEARQARPIERVEESVVDAASPSPGIGERCVIPDPVGTTCTARSTRTGGGTSQFSVEGTFPLEVRGFVTPGGSVNADVNITSSKGFVHFFSKWVQYEDEQGTLGLSRDDLNERDNWANLDRGQYTVLYVIDGNAAVGHTVVTYKR